MKLYSALLAITFVSPMIGMDRADDIYDDPYYVIARKNILRYEQELKNDINAADMYSRGRYPYLATLGKIYQVHHKANDSSSIKIKVDDRKYLTFTQAECLAFLKNPTLREKAQALERDFQFSNQHTSKK